MSSERLSRQEVPTQGAAPRRLRLGEMLVQAGVLKETQVMHALDMQKAGGGRLGAIFIQLKMCTEAQIRQALHSQFGIEVVDLGKVQPDPTLIELISLDLIRKYEVIPLKMEQRKLWIALLDPYNIYALDDIRFRTGISHLVVATCTETDYKRFIEEHLETRGIMDEILEEGEFYTRAVRYLQTREQTEAEERETAELTQELRLASSESPIIVLANFLLAEALRRRASDIHIEPFETSFRVRMRIDGRLLTILNPPQRLQGAVVARFKVMSAMDITKRRVPQDGHMAISYRGETVHFRVSTLPTVYGEKCVIRLLKKDFALADLDHLGLSIEHLRQFKRALAAPQGLILVTGPTGSGKTTTLHAGLNFVNNPEINIVTLEDPVEATMSGISHVAIQNQGGVTFSSGLRAILRQDPDIVFVGEIRDSEVAQIAIRAAQTGHLVLSTLHTNSAAESIIRLIDLGMEPFILAGALQLVAAQRLVRRICDACAEEWRPDDEEFFSLGLDPADFSGVVFRRGLGCPACLTTGYRGRKAVYEVIAADREIRELVRRNAGSAEITEASRRAGNVSLFAAGIEAVRNGVTTLSELRRVLLDEE